MIAIDTAQPYAPGYVELSHELFGALATIAKGNPDAESIRAGAEYALDGFYRPDIRVEDSMVWHVFADTPRGGFRYVVTDRGALLGVERFVEADDDGMSGGDWESVSIMDGIDPYTWEVRA